MAVIDGFKINGTDYDLRDAVAVCFNEAQSLTDQQKAAARGNIGIPDVMVSRFAGRKVSIIGDSISTFDAEGYKKDGYVQYYPRAGVTDPALTEPSQTWWMRVINASGAALEVNASWSGSYASNAVRTPLGAPDFYERTGLLGSPEIIFVALGTNDSIAGVALGEYDYETAYASLSEATFRTAYIKGLKALMANYPAAKIVPVIFHMGDGYAESILEIGAALDIEVVDARDYQDYNDTGHPGVIGMREISSMVLYHVDVELRTKGIPADAAAVGLIRSDLQEISESENLFDPENVNYLSAYIGQSDQQYTIVQGVLARTVYIRCEPNTKYTIRKVKSQRFWIGYTTVAPDIGVEVFGVKNDNTAAEQQIMTDANAAYIVMYIYMGDDTLTFEQICDTVVVMSGITAKDTVARQIANEKVNVNQGAENAGKVLLVDADGSVVPGKAQNGFNDAFRHYLEGALRAGMFTEDVSVMITRIAASMLGVDGVVQSADRLTVNYSLNDPEKTGTALVFS